MVCPTLAPGRPLYYLLCKLVYPPKFVFGIGSRIRSCNIVCSDDSALRSTLPPLFEHFRSCYDIWNTRQSKSVTDVPKSANKLIGWGEWIIYPPPQQKQLLAGGGASESLHLLSTQRPFWPTGGLCAPFLRFSLDVIYIHRPRAP